MERHRACCRTFFDSVDVTATGGGIWVGNVLPLTYSYSHFYITNNLGLRRHSASGILTQERTLDWIFVCSFQSDCWRTHAHAHTQRNHAVPYCPSVNVPHLRTTYSLLIIHENTGHDLTERKRWKKLQHMHTNDTRNTIFY